MSYSILIHEDTVSPGEQEALLRFLVQFSPRGTVVVRTDTDKSVMMRYPTIGVANGQVFLAYKGDIVYGNDIKFIEAYDPHPDFNPEAV